MSGQLGDILQWKVGDMMITFSPFLLLNRTDSFIQSPLQSAMYSIHVLRGRPLLLCANTF